MTADLVRAGDPGAAGDGWADRVAVADLGEPFDAPGEGAADDALVDVGDREALSSGLGDPPTQRHELGGVLGHDPQTHGGGVDEGEEGAAPRDVRRAW